MIPDAVHHATNDALRVDSFFVPPPGNIRIERCGERSRVWLDHPDWPLQRPIIDVRINPDQIAVARNIRMRGGDWISEVVATVPFEHLHLLERSIAMALTGTSRLPITSVETPHPVFTLGMLTYLPMGDRSVLGRARRLEARLRSGLPIDLVMDDLPAVVKTLFNHITLSPWGPLVPNLIDLILRCDRKIALDLLGYMIRHLARHLNAFDLIKFHNLGANYPDAFMLDALLRAFIGLLRGGEDQLLRRALRQGFLARKRCDGLLVPDHPASPGDNARDAPLPPVPSVQLVDPAARSRRLFQGEPADSLLTPVARALLVRSIADLTVEAELRELGTAIFLDRPLGLAHRDDEQDRTTLLSYEACSPRLIRQAFRELGAPILDTIRAPNGFPVASLPGHARSGVVSLEDAKKVALDFVFTRTTRSSLNELLSHYDFSPLNDTAPDAYKLLTTGSALLVRTGVEGLTLFDPWMSPVLRIGPHDSTCYFECGGIEYMENLCAVVDGRRVPLSPRF